MPHITPGDLLIVGTLVLLEGLLSADNALVLALIVRHLPAEQQKRALLYGLVGAFVLRGTGIFFAAYLMGLWWVCALGSAYLLFLGIKHFAQRSHSEADGDENAPKRAGMGFWQTVVVVELTDLVFAIDSILVAVALVHDPSRIWIVYVGGGLGIVLLRLAATFFIRLLEKYPSLDHLAYALVGWAGVKLASTAADVFHEAQNRAEPHYLPTWVFWSGFALILLVGSWYAVWHKRTPEDEEEMESNQDALDSLEDSGFLAPPGPHKNEQER